MAERWLTLDPGGATGWSKWRREEGKHPERTAIGTVAGGVLGFIDHLDALLESIDCVICEAFNLDDRTEDPDVQAVHVEGALILACVQRGIPLHWSPTSRKAAIRNDVLKQLGLWVTGRDVHHGKGDHANDSQRHALAYALLTLECQETARWLYPPRPRP